MGKNRLKEVLEQEGIKQSELAAQSNLSDGTINRICNKSRTPPPTTQNRIVKALNQLSDKNFSRGAIFLEAPGKKTTTRSRSDR